jgi:DNA repair protein RecO (recombination protein O)
MSEMIATELIVLHTTKVGDNSLVIHTLSKDYGRRSFLVRGAGKKAMALFLPLNILEAEIIESSKSTLYTAKNLVSACPLTGIRNSVMKNTMTMFMSEVIYRVVKEGASEEGLYEWAKKNIVLLDALETDFSNFHIRFLLEMTVVLGFSPESETMRHFAGEHYQMLLQFMKSPFAESMLIPMNGAQRNELSERIIRYIEYHTETSININSLKVLREVFA